MPRVSGRRAGLRYDAECGVATEALIFLGDLDPEAVGPSVRHATHYEPSPVGEVGRLLALIPFDARRATFVDVGAGMGRALLEAAACLPFRSAVGIEISPALAAVACENLERYVGPPLRCRDLRIVRADAASARLPRGDLVAYLYNPFDAAVLGPLVDRLARRDAATALVYHTPVERATIEAHPAFELVDELPFGAIFLTPGRGTSQIPFQAE